MPEGEKTRRNTVVSIRFDADELLAVKEHAKQSKLTMSAYVRARSLPKHKPRQREHLRAADIDNRALAKIMAELEASSIPQDLNQIAYQLNTRSQLDAVDKKLLMENLEQFSIIQSAILAVLKGVGR